MIEIKKYNKIIVVGSGGSGKSTFAKKLGAVTGLPVIHLDNEFWQPNWVETPRNEWIEKQKQFISGEKWIIDGNYGGTMDLRFEAAKREVFEESGVKTEKIIQLTSMCYIPTDIFPKKHLVNWSPDTYVVPEYSFAFECNGELILSHEHTECVWLTYKEACEKLKWDSNRTALYELKCRLEAV